MRGRGRKGSPVSRFGSGIAPLPGLFVQLVTEENGEYPVQIGHQTTAGNMLIFCLGLFFSGSVGGVINSVTDTQGNIWVVDVQPVNGVTGGAAIVLGIVRTKLTHALGVSDTISISTTPAFSSVTSANILEFTGSFFAASPFDTGNSQATTNPSTSLQCSVGALAQANELAIMGVTTGTFPGASTYGVPPGFTDVPMTISSNNGDSGYQKLSSNAPLSPTWLISPGNSLGGALATYKL